MINYEEELKKFKPSLDVDEAEGISGIDALVIQKVDAKLIKQEQLPLRK